MSQTKTEKPMSKKCTKCGETKLLTDFYVGGKCKECLKAMQRDRNKKNKELDAKIKSDPKQSSKPKTCSQCGKEKTIGDFDINRRKCHDCEKAYGRKYNKEHSEVRTKWQEENKEHFAELQASWYQKNKPKVNAKYNKRCREDQCFNIRRMLRKRLLNCIKKIKSTEDYTGTKFENVAKWLEYNFTDEMTWENHGTVWDIDHVVPISKWDLNNCEHVDMCFNWKNLSPLECPKNRHVKRDKIDSTQLEAHLECLEKYCSENKFTDELQLFVVKYTAHIKTLKNI
jgi:hypothetical protein